MPRGGKRENAGRRDLPDGKKRVAFNCRIDPETDKRIRQLVDETGKSKGVLIDEAIKGSSDGVCN